MLELVVNAIEGRKTLEINYYPGSRSIEPHAVGYGADGQLLLRAFQTGGASSSGRRVDWKLLRLDRAEGANTDGMSFARPRPGYSSGDKAMRGGIIAEL